MKFISYRDANEDLRRQAFQLYENSFPQHERRSLASHSTAVEDTDYEAEIVVSDNTLQAIFFYWRAEQMIYIEYLAVNPELRGQNIGSTILTKFIEQNSNKTIILEIDPLVDEIARRRLRFYQHLGFHQNHYHYIHPSYKINGMKHQLVILSHPRTISQAEFDDFTNFMRSRVLTYID